MACVAGVAVLVSALAAAVPIPEGSPGSGAGPAPQAATRARVIERLAEMLEARYVLPDLGARMAGSLRERQSEGAYEPFDDPEALARKLTDDLRAVSQDGHLRVFWSPEPLREDGSRTEPSPEERIRIRDRYRRENFGFAKVERLAGNIGYLDLRYFAWADAVGDRVAGSMAFLADTDALVVDLRQNGGAIDPSAIALVCGYLLAERTLINELHWREGGTTRVEQSWTPGWVPGRRYLDKPVYLLTSRRTFSGAEEFAYDLQVLKRATVVGETTGGGANPGGDVRLDEHFGVFLPTGRAVNPTTRTNWEGTGVLPDVPTGSAKALVVARQTALECLLAAAGPDDPRRGDWENALRLARADAARFLSVVFRLEAHADARFVGLAGEFNGWNPTSSPMERRNGGWEAAVDLEAGRYAYKLVVDGRWITDPANPETVMDGPHTNSVRTVAAPPPLPGSAAR